MRVLAVLVGVLCGFAGLSQIYACVLCGQLGYYVDQQKYFSQTDYTLTEGQRA